MCFLYLSVLICLLLLIFGLLIIVTVCGGEQLGLSQGSAGLYQRIQPYLSLTEGNVFELTQVGEETSPWTDTVDKMTSGEHVLSKMMEAIAGDTASANTGGYDEEDDNDSTYSRESNSIDSDEAPDQAYNVRIKSKRFIRDMEIDEDVVAPGREDKDAKDDDKDGKLNVSVDLAVSVEKEHEDPNIPSRVAVKKVSARRTVEEKRKEDMATRRQALLARMEAKGKSTAGAEIIDSEFKAQKASADR
jgi:hypothetical protein